MTAPTSAREGLAVERIGLARLRSRCERAVRRARRDGGEVLVGVTVPLPSTVDPSAVAFASRRAGEPWFCFEQPDRDRAALAALGCARRLRAPATSPDRDGRFGRVAA